LIIKVGFWYDVFQDGSHGISKKAQSSIVSNRIRISTWMGDRLRASKPVT